MKDNKKFAKIIFGVVCIIIVAVCIVIQVVLKNEDKKLEEESKKYETLNITTTSGVEIETEYIQIDNAKIYIKIPKNFKQLDYETITQKYSGEVPSIVFSNDETTINLAISITKNEMKDSQIDYMEKILESNSEIINKYVYEVNGHNIGKIELISDAADTKVYNNMICFSYNGNLIIVTFNCTEELRKEWINVGKFIIDSLFFKE